MVIVVPGGADHVKLWHPQGFNLKIAACFTKVSILMFKGYPNQACSELALSHPAASPRSCTPSQVKDHWDNGRNPHGGSKQERSRILPGTAFGKEG